MVKKIKFNPQITKIVLNAEAAGNICVCHNDGWQTKLGYINRNNTPLRNYCTVGGGPGHPAFKIYGDQDNQGALQLGGTGS